jgi:hypothetical protein
MPSFVMWLGLLVVFMSSPEYKTRHPDLNIECAIWIAGGVVAREIRKLRRKDQS